MDILCKIDYSPKRKISLIQTVDAINENACIVWCFKNYYTIDTEKDNSRTDI